MINNPYQGDKIPPLPNALKSRSKIMQTCMSFGSYANLNPYKKLMLDADTVQDADKKNKNFYKDDWWWNSERICFLNDGGLISLFLFLIPGIIWIAVNSTTLYYATTSFNSPEMDHLLSTILFMVSVVLWILFLITSFPIIFNGFFWLFLTISKPFEKNLLARLDKTLDKKRSEFNRSDGMVRLAISKKEKFVAPLIEFDPYIESVIKPAGVFYRLMLVHRYTGRMFTKINLMEVSSDQQEVYALWDMLQRFMDISQPLPDMPRLEPFRHLDPLTAAHDLETERPIRFWRDLDLKAWDETEGAKLAKANREFNWSGLRCKLTPQLGKISMEEYQANKAALGSK